MKTPSRRLDLLLLLALCAVCFFWRLGSVGLFDFNEALYTEAAREMYLRGDWVTARVNGVPFFDKPPLALWQCVICFHLFGVTEFAARLPVAIASTLLVLLTWWFGIHCFGRRTGFLAGTVLALSPMYFATARQMTMDIHQSLWFAAAMVSFYLGYVAQSRQGKLWYYAFWASCGLSFMAKSFPGVLPVFLCLAFVALAERLRPRGILARVWETKPLPGVALFAAIVAPWFWLAYAGHGYSFYYEYFLHHNVQILNGKDFGHAQPFWYYVPALLVGLSPWALFLPWALWPRTSAADDDPVVQGRADQVRLFLVVWAVGLVLMFTCMTSKLISYLLPMYPAAALLVGVWLDRTLAERRGAGLAIGVTAMAAGAVGVFVGARVWLAHIAGTPAEARLQYDMPGDLLAFASAVLLLLAIGFSSAALLAWARKRTAAVAAVVLTMAACVIFCLTRGLPAAQATYNAPLHTLAQEAGRLAPTGASLAVHIARPVRPSVFFYLPARFLTGPLPQAERPGLLFESGEIGPMAEFAATSPSVWILTDEKRARALVERVPEARTVERHGRWVLLHAAHTPRLTGRPDLGPASRDQIR